MAAVEHAQRPASYDAIMGLTGIAFILPLREDFRRAPGDADRCARIPEALAALGLRGQWRLLGGGEVAAGSRSYEEGEAGRCQDEDRADTCEDERPDAGIIEIVQQAIDADFAVPILGWPGEREDWAIVTGYDCGRGVICGWPGTYAGEEYLGAPPTSEAVVIIQEPVPPSDELRAVTASLQWAAAQRKQVAQAYDLWREMLDEKWEAGPEDPDLASRALRHEAATEALADARSAAAGFLRHCAELLDSVGSQWALAAADTYGILVERVEARRPPLFDEGAGEALASSEWRATWRQQLEEIAETDARALAQIEKALTSDHGPREMEHPSVPW